MHPWSSGPRGSAFAAVRRDKTVVGMRLSGGARNGVGGGRRHVKSSQRFPETHRRAHRGRPALAPLDRRAEDNPGENEPGDTVPGGRAPS